MDRHIDFEAIENFRDFGGYPTACGRSLVRGKLYRSGNHSLATDADLARLKALRIAAIVDLRHPLERARDPSRRWPDFAGAVIDNDIGSDVADWVETLKAQTELSAEWFFENGLEHYRRNAFQPRHIDLFRRFFHAVADHEGAVVIHCAAGKDRTGLACALLHHMAGVHQDDIIADYLLTNDESRIQRKIESTGVWLEQQLGWRPADEAVRVACSVFPEYLEASFASIEDQCGSVDGYFERVLGLTPEDRRRIHDEVLG